MCVFDFLFSLPVLVAVAWRVCMIKRTKQTKKKCLEKLCSHRPKQQKRERGLFLVGGVYVLVCVPSRFCCEYVFVAVAVTVRLRSSSILWAPGAWIGLCVFVFLSQARALSLSVFRFSHTVSVSRNCSPFLLAVISTSIWLLLPESIIFFYYVFLLPLICNNSCILRDATVCVCVFVFVVCTVQKREVLPYCSCLSACVFSLLFVRGCDSFYLQ